VVLAMLAATSFTFGLISAIASEIPSLDPENRKEVVNGYIYAADGKRVLAVLRGSESRVLVEFDAIAPEMIQAIVAIEDRRFWDHRGIDLRGIGRALWADIPNQAVVQGGSTITQQFVKNAYVKKQRSIGRKVREAALAWQLEDRWSKERILTAYLNTIYFGNGAYGIEQAARVYFDHSAFDLTLPEAALLAGIPADPSGYDPVTRPGAARERRAKVLGDMLELGYINRRDHDEAARAPLPRPEQVGLPGVQGPAQYFTNYVKQQLIEDDDYGPREVFGGGLRIRTTIDLGVQQLAREAIAKWLPDPEGPSAALVAIDPTTGNVLAMFGGRNFRESQFNLAVQGRRQPGSAFKPFVLATALEQGISPATYFESKPLSISLGDKLWLVENYEGSDLGPIDLATATIHSDNTVFAELTRLVRPAKVAATARRLGIASPLQNYFSIGLGAQAVNPLELARAYSAFANGGYRIDTRSLGNRPRVIQEIRDENDEVVDRNVQASHQVLSTRSARTVNQLLQKVITQGTGRRAALAGWPAAGKTGTTENHGDAWFVGYTPQLVVAVWVGYPHQLRPMLTEFRGQAVAGGTYPALIWKSFMESALTYLDKEPVGFKPPDYDSTSALMVAERDGKVRRDNGLCRNRREIVYYLGSEPRSTANCKPNEVEVPRVIGQTLSAAKARLALQPLTPTVVYKPARPRQRVDIVISQFPAKGRLSSFDTVTLVFAKAVHGLVPNVEGNSLAQARRRLRQRRLTGLVTGFTSGPSGQVVSQSPPGGVAAAPGMTVKLLVARASKPVG
jgi:penicillin-binding protein 1A